MKSRRINARRANWLRSSTGKSRPQSSGAAEAQQRRQLAVSRAAVRAIEMARGEFQTPSKVRAHGLSGVREVK